MTHYELVSETFTTPRGRHVTMVTRAGTNDHNVLFSCLNEDEYSLRELRLSGTALDIGAHIGGVTVALAMDNPDLRVIAVEAVPPNIELLRENVARNGLTDRVELVHAAAGKGKTAVVKWAFEGSGDVGSHNAFVGNALLDVPVEAHQKTTLPVRTLSSLVGDGVSFVKIDCEGCEWDVIGPALAKVERCHGEWHPTGGHTRADIEEDLTAAGFDVTFTGPLAGPGGFEAVR